MVIEDIIRLDARRSRIIVDGETAFALYRGEIRQMKLRAGEEISEETRIRIYEEILPKRARERSVHYLKDQARTCAEVRRKLREGYYPPEIIDEVIGWLERCHYIDDSAYIRGYLDSHRERYSAREMQQKLLAKGLDRRLVQSLLSESDTDGGAAIRRLLKRRHYSREDDPDTKRRTAAYLFRKGFDSEDIRREMEHFDPEASALD